MSVVCSICQESLLDHPNNAQEADIIVKALQCGHLYHEICIGQWFQSGPREEACPTCKRACRLATALRVFPTSSGEESATSSSSSTGRRASQDVLDELEDVRSVMEHMTIELESKRNEHALLSLENGKLRSELGHLREEMRDSKELGRGLELSLTSKVEELEKEKNELIRRVKEKEDNLLRRLERIRTILRESKPVYPSQKKLEEECEVINEVILNFSNITINASNDNVSEYDDENDDDEDQTLHIRLTRADFW